MRRDSGLLGRLWAAVSKTLYTNPWERIEMNCKDDGESRSGGEGVGMFVPLV